MFNFFRRSPPAPQLQLIDSNEVTDQVTLEISLSGYTCSHYEVEIVDPSMPDQKPQHRTQRSSIFKIRNLKFNHEYEFRGKAMVNEQWTPFSDVITVTTSDLTIQAKFQDRGFDWVKLTIVARTAKKTLKDIAIQAIELKCFEVDGRVRIIKHEQSTGDAFRISQLEPGTRYAIEIQAMINDKWTTKAEINCETRSSM